MTCRLTAWSRLGAVHLLITELSTARHQVPRLPRPAEIAGKCFPQWRSQKFSTGQSICGIPFCPFPFSCPTMSAVQPKNVVTYQFKCIFLTGGAYAPYATCVAMPLVFLFSKKSPFTLAVGDRCRYKQNCIGRR